MTEEHFVSSFLDKDLKFLYIEKETFALGSAEANSAAIKEKEIFIEAEKGKFDIVYRIKVGERNFIPVYNEEFIYFSELNFDVIHNGDITAYLSRLIKEKQKESPVKKLKELKKNLETKKLLENKKNDLTELSEDEKGNSPRV